MEINLIELFAGVGSQAMALRNLGVPFKHHRVVEFDRFAIASYNAVHGTDFPTHDITEISSEGLGIEEGKLYWMFYSFPCQDLSVAGQGKGMGKGSGTRSGLLWEVERLLKGLEYKPQVLIMENVKAIINKNHLPSFLEWQEALESLGYTNQTFVMNAKDFGVAQNRERVFMVSTLDGKIITEPMKVPLAKRMKDYLEPVVDEMFYINNERAKKLISDLVERGLLETPAIVASRGRNTEKPSDRTAGAQVEQRLEPNQQGMANTLTSVQKDNLVVERLGGLYDSSTIKHQMGSVWCSLGVCPTMDAMQGGYRQPLIVEPAIQQVGNLTPQPKRKNPNAGRVYLEGGLSPALSTMQGGNRQPCVIEEGFVERKYREFVESNGYIPEGFNPYNCKEISEIVPTVTAQGGSTTSSTTSSTKSSATVLISSSTSYRIRKLTPLECWRLMGFSDDDFYKAQAVNSNTQLYKQAGNSIVVPVLEALFKEVLVR